MKQITAHHSDTLHAARILAWLGMIDADTAIAAWDSKYAWRNPVPGIAPARHHRCEGPGPALLAGPSLLPIKLCRGLDGCRDLSDEVLPDGNAFFQKRGRSRQLAPVRRCTLPDGLLGGEAAGHAVAESGVAAYRSDSQ